MEVGLDLENPGGFDVRTGRGGGLHVEFVSHHHMLGDWACWVKTTCVLWRGEKLIKQNPARLKRRRVFKLEKLLMVEKIKQKDYYLT